MKRYALAAILAVPLIAGAALMFPDRAAPPDRSASQILSFLVDGGASDPLTLVGDGSALAAPLPFTIPSLTGGDPVKLLRCDADMSGIAADAAAGFLVACEDAAAQVEDSVDPNMILARANSAREIEVPENGTLIGTGGEIICDVSGQRPVPARGQTVADFLRNKPLCLAFIQNQIYER